MSPPRSSALQMSAICLGQRFRNRCRTDLNRDVTFSGASGYSPWVGPDDLGELVERVHYAVLTTVSAIANGDVTWAISDKKRTFAFLRNKLFHHILEAVHGVQYKVVSPVVYNLSRYNGVHLPPHPLQGPETLFRRQLRFAPRPLTIHRCLNQKLQG